MLRHHLPLIPAEQLGFYLGLTVPAEKEALFWNPRTGEKPPAGYGTRVREPEFNPNQAFISLNIPLELNWQLIDNFPTLSEFHNYLETISETETDILVCFDWPTLFDSQSPVNWGHVCVLDKIDKNNNQLRIIDPAENAPKWRIVTISDMYTAMQTHTATKSGGLWEIKLKS